MTFKLLSRLSLLVLIGTLIFSSCTKDNSVTIKETEEELTAGLRMNVNGADLELNAVAGYCQNDSIEVLIIANKEENLSFPLLTENFVENDYVYLSTNSENTSWGYGGQALGPDVTGLPYDLAILFSDATIKIDSNDGEVVVGNSSGVLYAFDINDPNGGLLEFPYSMDFVANIVQDSVSPFCE